MSLRKQLWMQSGCPWTSPERHRFGAERQKKSSSDSPFLGASPICHVTLLSSLTPQGSGFLIYECGTEAHTPVLKDCEHCDTGWASTLQYWSSLGVWIFRNSLSHHSLPLLPGFSLFIIWTAIQVSAPISKKSSLKPLSSCLAHHLGNTRSQLLEYKSARSRTYSCILALLFAHFASVCLFWSTQGFWSTNPCT